MLPHDKKFPDETSPIWLAPFRLKQKINKNKTKATYWPQTYEKVHIQTSAQQKIPEEIKTKTSTNSHNEFSQTRNDANDKFSFN